MKTIITLFLTLLCSGMLNAQTNVSGLISSNTTWNLSGSPYMVTDNILIASGALLTIEPGVSVRFNQGKYLRVIGTLIARGTTDNMITFEGNNTSWQGIEMRPGSGTVFGTDYSYGSGSEIKFVNIKNAAIGLYLYRISLLVSHSTFSENTTGLELRAIDTVQGVKIDQCNFKDNNSGIYSIYENYTGDYYGEIRNTQITSNSFINNTFAGIDLNSNQRVFENLNIKNNYFSQNNIGLKFGGGGYGPRVDGVYIENNIAYKNTVGISVDRIYSYDGSLTYPVVVARNKVIDNTSESLLLEYFGSGKILIEENILKSSTGKGIRFQGSPVSNGYLITKNQIISNTTVITIDGTEFYYPSDMNFTFNTLSGGGGDKLIEIKYGTHIFNRNNLFPVGYYALYNESTNNIDAKNNYWGTSNSGTIASLIYDFFDNFDKGTVDYTGYLTAYDTTAPISQPANVHKIPVAGGLKLVWATNQEADVQGYRIYYRNYTGYSFSNVVDAGNVVEYTIPGVMLNDTVAVTAYDIYADGLNDQTDGHESWFAISAIAPPSAPVTLAGPQNGMKNLPLSITLAWNKDSYSEQYQLQVATDSLFVSKVVNDSTITDTVKQVTLSSYNQTYYWRVKGRNIGGTGPYSAVWKFTTTLANPVLTAPSNGQQNVATDPTLGWNAVPGAATYHLQVSLDNVFSQVIIDDSLIGAVSKQIGPLSRKKTYYWHVRAKNLGGAGGFSVTSNFTTYDTIPGVPTLALPANGSINQPAILTLSWNASTLAATYHLQVSIDSVFGTFIVNDSALTATSKQVGPLSLSSLYYWRVKAKNPGGSSQFSSAWKFGTSVSVPSITNIVAGNKTVSLSWTIANTSNIIKYKIYRGIFSGSLVLIDSVNAPTNMYQNSGLSNGQRYYYKVAAVNQYVGQSSLSNEVNALPFNSLPNAVPLNNIFDPNTGKATNKAYQFSSAGSTDADGTIDSVFWYVNDVLRSDSSSLSYQFGPGTSIIKLVVQDNDGAKDTSVAVVTRVYFRIKLGGPIYSGISLIGDDVVYTVASGDAVYKMTSAGITDYSLQVDGDVRSSSSIAFDTTVYIASSDKNLYAFSKFGTQLWPALAMGAELTVTPTIDSVANRIYLGVTNRNFQAINRLNGTVAWSYFSDSPIQQSAVITNDRRLIFSTVNGTLYGFNLDALSIPATPAWTVAVGDTISTSPAIDLEGNFYVGTSSGKVVKVIMSKAQPGTIVWQTAVGGRLTASPVIDANGTLYIGSSSGKFFAINTATGEIKWEFVTPAAIKSTAAISNSGRICFGNDAGTLYVIDSLESLKWFYKDSSSIVAPVSIQNGVIYIGTVSGNVVGIYDLDSADGNNTQANMVSSVAQGRLPIWGTYQGNNSRTGVQSIAGITNVLSKEGSIPSQYYLSQNFPNPFNPSTTFRYGVPYRSTIRIIISNILGQVVTELVNVDRQPGNYEAVWNATVASGIYFYRLEAMDAGNAGNRFIQTKKMILLK